MRMSDSLCTVLPESRFGTATIEHYEIKHHGAGGFFAMRDGIPEGKYCRLMVNGSLWMSDTPMEYATNHRIRKYSFGDILIAGLGLGMVLRDILGRDNVTSVTVVEKNPDVISLVWPRHEHPKLTVVQGDIYEWRPAKGTRYDCIYFDIWADQSTDCLGDMGKLHRAFAPFRRRDSGGWMDSWNRDVLRARKRSESRRGGWYK